MTHWYEALIATIRDALRPTDYHALYATKVVGQNADGTLELAPAGTRMPPVSRVPVRYGTPATLATVEVGASVLLGFEDGDPGRPYAALWGVSICKRCKIACETLDLHGDTVNLGPSASLGVARKTDTVHSPGGTACIITLTAPVPAPGFVVAPGTPLAGTIVFTPPLEGRITSANDSVRA